MTEDRVRITHTPIGTEYGWDFADQADLAMLRHNLACKIRVMDNPKQFPKADHEKLWEQVCELQDFLVLYS